MACHFLLDNSVIIQINQSSRNLQNLVTYPLCLPCACVLSCFSHVELFATLWTVALQAYLSMGILQARILEWVAMLSSRGSTQPRDQTKVSRNVGGFFTVLSELPGKPIFFIDSTYMLDSSPSLFQRLHPFYLLLMMKLWIIFSVMAGEVMKGRGL